MGRRAMTMIIRVSRISIATPTIPLQILTEQVIGWMMEQVEPTVD